MKKYLIPPAVRQMIANDITGLEIKWSVSRARDTYGYNRASLWIHTPSGGRYKAASSTGGGDDLPGACLGDWIAEYKPFKPGLVRCKSQDFYGLTFYDEKARKGRKRYNPGNKIIIDGKCGFSAMEEILSALGFYLTRTENKASLQYYAFRSF